MLDFKINKQKALNSLLYVIHCLNNADKHKVFKILYFADQKHLLNYGRPIIGDTYLKMDFGPVPSYVKNLVENQVDEFQNMFSLEGYYINAKDEANLDFLSEAELESLDEAINENSHLSFSQLTDKSHDFAYNNSSWPINYIDIAKAVNADETILNLIKLNSQNDNIVLR